MKSQSLIIADTNNHRIISMDVNTKEATIIQPKFPVVPIKIEKRENYTKNNLITSTYEIKVNGTDDAKLILEFDCGTIKGDKDLHLTPEAPQRWLIRILDTTLENDLTNEWDIVGGIRNGKDLPMKIELHKKPDLKLVDDFKRIVRLELFISLCENSLCFIKRFAVDFNLMMANDVNVLQTYNLNVKLASDGSITSIAELK